MSKKGLFIALGAAAVAAAALIPFKVENEKDDENKKTTTRLRSLSYRIEITTSSNKSVDFSIKAPGVGSLCLVNVDKHIDLPQSEEPFDYDCDFDCDNCENPCESAISDDEELNNLAQGVL